LAIGGYTTYHIMPDDYSPPADRPQPSIGHNITKAIDLNPQAIVINLPSNDASNGFTVEEQLANYDTVLALAGEADIPVWVATTQPRNLDSLKRDNLMAMRDSTHARFGDKAIDFWTGIAKEDGTIKDAYNSGDGVHLNNTGHYVLFSRVRDKNIQENFIVNSIDEISYNKPTAFELFQNYPNPFNPSTTLKFSVKKKSHNKLTIYNQLGQKIITLADGVFNQGVHTFYWDATGFASGTYYYVLENGKNRTAKKLLLIK
jgi:hypothetical protein